MAKRQPPTLSTFAPARVVPSRFSGPHPFALCLRYPSPFMTCLNPGLQPPPLLNHLPTLPVLATNLKAKD